MLSRAQLAGRWALPIALAGTLAIAERPAWAQRPVVEANATVNVGYNQFSQSTFQADPMAEPEDIPDETDGRLFSEIRPAISIQNGSPRLIWRAQYQLSGNFALNGDPAYSNQVDLGLVGQPSKYTAATLSATVSQGGTSFQLSQRPAESGAPEIRAPGNPNLVSATLSESFTWDAGRRLGLRQSLTGSASAPQDDFSELNAAVTATVGLETTFPRNAVGVDVRLGAARLRPLREDLEPYLSVTNALLGRWNHDFSPRWNGVMIAGVEQVYTDTGSKPLALLPSGSIIFLYTTGMAAAGLDLSHGTATNIQVGTVSITDRIGVRGSYILNPDKLRMLSFSAGFLHNEPIGESETLVAAGTGNAIQGDAGFNTAFTPNVVLNVRYSLAYQYGQVGGLEASTAHIFLIGISGRVSNTKETRRPMPVRGRRVDGSDGLGFPAGGNPVPGSGEEPVNRP